MGSKFFKEKKNHTPLIVAILCVLYIFFAAIPIKSELHFCPEWTVNVSNADEEKSDKQKIPFKFSDCMGYFTEDGKITKKISIEYKGTISEKYNIKYFRDSSALELFNQNGAKVSNINAQGFPYLKGEKIYLMLPGGTSFSNYDEKSNLLWTYESFSPITAFDATKNGTVAGYADGKIISFDSTGNILQRFNPSGSEHEVILGAASSQDNSMVACVSGIGGQRIVIAQKNNLHSKIIFHEYLEKEFLRQCILKFNEKGTYLYFDCEGKLGIIDLKKLKSSYIELSGVIDQIEFCDEKKLVYILSHNKLSPNENADEIDGDLKKYTVTLLEDNGTKLAVYSFDGKSAFIQVHDSCLYTGRDGKISKLSVVKK